MITANEANNIMTAFRNAQKEAHEKQFKAYLEKFVYEPIRKHAEQGKNFVTITSSTLFTNDEVCAALEKNGYIVRPSYYGNKIYIEW